MGNPLEWKEDPLKRWGGGGEGGGVGPGTLGGTGEALGRGVGGWEGVAGPLIPIGPIDYCSSILYILYMDCLWILTYIDPQDPFCK